MARGEDRAEAVAVHKDASIYVVITDDELKCIKSARGRAIRILHFAPPRLESVEKSSPISVREDEIVQSSSRQLMRLSPQKNSAMVPGPV